MDQLEQARSVINDVDEQMAALFVRRMEAAAQAAAYKREHDLRIYDPAREQAILTRGSALIEDEALRPYYRDFLEAVLAISKRYQRQLIGACDPEGGETP